MVIQGTDYFTSSKDVFFLRVRGDEFNTKGNGAGNLVIFLAKSFIILTTLLGIFSFMMDYGYEMEDIFRTSIVILSLIIFYLFNNDRYHFLLLLIQHVPHNFYPLSFSFPKK